MIFISQPTFFPWLGYFDLIDQSELVVLLDDVSFAKQSWQTRNNFKTNTGLKPFIIPISSKNSKSKLIKDTLIFDNHNLTKKFNHFLTTNYSKSKYFKNYIDELNNNFKTKIDNRNLLELNLNMINWCLKVIGIKKKIILSSSLNCKLTKTEKIIEICKKLDFNKYLSTSGAVEYLSNDKKMFIENKIEVYEHQYKHPIYKQNYGKFVEFACILDLIFNEGPNSYDVIISGRRKSVKIFN